MTKIKIDSGIATSHLRPTKLHLHITSKCTYRCKHCCSNASSMRESTLLSLEDVKVRVLDQAAGFGMESFEMSGGEPTLLNENFIFEAFRHASELGLKTTLCTNSCKLTERYASKLARSGLWRVKLSLYGTKAETHDSFTGVPGSFNRVVRGIQAAKDMGIEVWVHCVVTPFNLGEMLTVPSLLDPFGVDIVQLGSVVPVGRARALQGYQFSEEELDEVVRSFERHLSSLLHRRYFFTISLYPVLGAFPFEGRYCSYLVDRLVVDSRGDVIPCCILPTELGVIGNLRVETLQEICSLRRVESGWVSGWLYKGHEAMQKRLEYDRTSHNLCALCIDMFGRLYRMLDDHVRGRT